MSRTGMVTFTPERWISLLNDAELEVRSYSGRAMYGKECVAAVLPPGDVLALGARLAAVAVTKYVEGAPPDDPLEAAYEAVAAVAAAMGAARQDDMGRDSVVYWPRMAWKEEQR